MGTTTGAASERQALAIHPVTAERLADLEALFDSRATLRGCRCMIFRAGPDGKLPEPSGAPRKLAMRELVTAGTPVGLLGYPGRRARRLVLARAPRHLSRPGGGRLPGRPGLVADLLLRAGEA